MLAWRIVLPACTPTASPGERADRALPTVLGRRRGAGSVDNARDSAIVVAPFAAAAAAAAAAEDKEEEVFANADGVGGAMIGDGDGCSGLRARLCACDKR